MLKGKKIALSISFHHLFLFIFLYLFGFYGYGTIEPIWQNLDGLVFYWITQILTYTSIAIVILSQYRTSVKEINKKRFRIELSRNDQAAFLIYFVLLCLVNFRSLNDDLSGDETSWAGYVVHHFDKLLYKFPSTDINNFKASQIYQLLIFITIIVILMIWKIISKLSWKNVIIILAVFTILLRFLNETIFKLTTSNLTYTDPFYVFYQVGISILGFSSTTFRITNLIVFSSFMLILHLILNRLHGYSFIKSSLATSLIVSVPLVLSVSTKVDHIVYAYFAQTILMIAILSPKPLPKKFIAIFVVLCVYFSLVNLMILFSLLLYFLLSEKRRNEIRQHILSEWQIYIYLLPQVAVHFPRLVKNYHLQPLITGYVYIPYSERFEKLFQNLLTASNLYIFILAVIGFIIFPKRQLNRSFILIFFIVSLLVQTTFASSALGQSRYALQVLYCYFTVTVIQLLRYSYKRVVYIGLILLNVANYISFISYQESFSSFDKFVRINQWNIEKDQTSSNTAKNVIWPAAAYGNYIKNYEATSAINSCVLVGLYYETIPYALAGQTVNSLRIYKEILLNFRSENSKFADYSPGKSFSYDYTKCIIISQSYYKEELVSYLVSQGWYIDSTETSGNGIKIYVLKIK
jgi:hypothetical protein